jgi:1,3-beta-glucan synthase
LGPSCFPILVLHLVLHCIQRSNHLSAEASSSALTLSATAFRGAVAIITMTLATLAEFSYIPMTWNNTSHHARRLLFLLATLSLTAGPTVYIAIVENQSGGGGSLPHILSIARFFISVMATLLSGIMPSGQRFGNRVASKSRKYLASQTFSGLATPSYPLKHSSGVWLFLSPAPSSGYPFGRLGGIFIPLY